MLNKRKSMAIMNYTQATGRVLVEMTWGIRRNYYDDEGTEADDSTSTTTPQNIPYELWMTAHDPILGMETLHNLKTVTLAMDESVHFSPRYSLIDGQRFGCIDSNGNDNVQLCDHLCTN